jgi:hypothetical protein
MTEKNKFTDQAHALTVQDHQLKGAHDQLGRLQGTLEAMDSELRSNQDTLDSLLIQAHTIVSESEIIFEVDEEDAFLTEKTLYINESEIPVTHQPLGTLDDIEITESMDWEQYLNKVEAYAARHGIDFGDDPFRDLMSVSQQIALEKRIKEEFSLKGAHCDKYDYMIAGTCGLIGGLVDVIFTGIPGDSALGNIADKHASKATEIFAGFVGFDKSKVEGNYKRYAEKQLAKGKPLLSLENYVAQRRIQFLEDRFKVNYDQTSKDGTNGTGGKVENLYASNHHIKSLGHSPDIVGLFFSILNQFTNTSTFISEGKIVTISTKTFELQGGNFLAKVFCGFVNWFGHIMSDLAGSNNSISKGNRGTGVPIPFYPLLQFINVGEFSYKQNSETSKNDPKESFATIAVRVFEEGYDFRHGMALAIPVLVTELLTRIMWTVKQHFHHKIPWSECIPSANNSELRRMLLIAHGSLCLVDTTDAALRSGGNMIQFMLRSNLIAWARFGTLALKELNAWYRQGGLDIEAVDEYLDAEYSRLLVKQ